MAAARKLLGEAEWMLKVTFMQIDVSLQWRNNSSGPL